MLTGSTSPATARRGYGYSLKRGRFAAKGFILTVGVLLPLQLAQGPHLVASKRVGPS